MHIKKLIHFITIVFIAVGLSAISVAQDGGEVNLDEGAALFKTNCAQCHNKNMVDDLTGPALAGSGERWSEYPREDLYAWVRNSQALISSGHPRATLLWRDWKPTEMTGFPGLTDQQIENIFAYVEGVASGEIGGASNADGQVVIEKEVDFTFLYIALAIVLLGLAIILARISSVLNALAVAKETGNPVQPQSLMQILTSKTMIFFVIFSIVIFGGYTTVNSAIELGRQQGYQPEQPIKFSHVTHAGVNKIDCQFCHDGARRSKHSVIPSGKTCMKCHKAIKVGSTYGTQELTKIYVSVGYNPNTDNYIDDYMEMSQDSVAEIYKKWIGDQYVKEKAIDSIDGEGKRVVAYQWSNIVEALTNEQKDKVQGGIEWVRVHNLPDHVYFNHAQHVAVGEVACEQCHGNVSEMEVLEQHAPLSMGWCVNCHRQSNVKGFQNNNEYYISTYEEYIEAINNGERDAVTVEDIGGLECQKCHY